MPRSSPVRPAALAPESRLLLLLVQRRLGPEELATSWTLLAAPLDWSALISQAREHGVLPLVARHLEAFGPSTIPEAVRAELATFRRLNGIRNALLAGDLADVLQLFGRAGIAAMPLKGPVLAEALYGDLSARVCADLDILIPRQMFARAHRLLLDAGYEPGEPGPVAPEEFPLLLESNLEYAFVRRQGGLSHILEVHWDVAWRWRGSARAIEDLWAEARRFSFRGAPAFGLSPEWQLLYLSVHAARHRWQELRWLVDVHELCREEDLDWQRLEDKARRFAWEIPLAVTLTAAHALLRTPVPRPFRVAPLPRWVRLFPAAPIGPTAWDAPHAAHLFAGVRGKGLYLARLLLSPTLADRRLVRLPERLTWLYYALRPVRLGLMRARRVCRALGGWLCRARQRRASDRASDAVATQGASVSKNQVTTV